MARFRHNHNHYHKVLGVHLLAADAAVAHEYAIGECACQEANKPSQALTDLTKLDLSRENRNSVFAQLQVREFNTPTRG